MIGCWIENAAVMPSVLRCCHTFTAAEEAAPHAHEVKQPVNTVMKGLDRRIDIQPAEDDEGQRLQRRITMQFNRLLSRHMR